MSENAWIDCALAAAHPSSGFREACLAAADRAAAIQGLRPHAHRVARETFGIKAFLSRICALARVSLSSTLAWTQLDLSTPQGPSFAEAWGRLAATLRLEWREASLHLRISLLNAAGVAVALPVVRGRGADDTSEDALLEAERAVDEAGWSQPRFAVLHARESEAAQAFGAEGG